MDIDQILDIISNDIRISDLHISAGDYVSYRMNGDIIKKTERGIVSAEFMELFLKYLLQSNGDKIAKFRADKDMDFAYISKHNTPYRVNAFVKL